MEVKLVCMHFQLALAETEAGIVNVLSASSCFFTLILGAIFPSTPADKATITKVIKRCSEEH